jgi:hypothetical protein
MLSETLKTGRPVDSTAHFGDAVVFYPVAVSLTLTSHSVIRLSSNEDGFLGALDEIRPLPAFICESWKASI